MRRAFSSNCFCNARALGSAKLSRAVLLGKVVGHKLKQQQMHHFVTRKKGCPQMIK